MDATEDKRINTYLCGKCGGPLYRDDDDENGIPFLACFNCGGRWPGKFKPVKIGGDDKEPHPAGLAGSVSGHEKVLTIQTERKETIKMEKKKNDRHMKICADCGELKPHHGRGLCGTCYSRRKTAGTLPPLFRDVSEPAQVIAAAGTPVMASEARQPQEAPEAVISVHSPSILLVFPSPDSQLYDAILAEARRNRRDPDQQILWIVQQTLGCGKAA